MFIQLQKISDTTIEQFGANLHVLRLDQTHPHISGNKFFKLKYNIEEAKRTGKNKLLTFGGAYSNHIAATAAVGKEFGFETLGVIRGEELASPLPSAKESLREKRREINRTLQFSQECGMQLHFISRDEYRKKDSPDFIEKLKKQFGDFYLLPEGGTNELAIKGCAEIPSFINIPFDFVCCPVGTGGTLSGIISALKPNQQALGFSALNAADYFDKEVQKWLFNCQIPQLSNYQINNDFHFGGYAKHSPELLKFISAFEVANNIPLEQVYTGKMMFGIYNLIKKGHFKKNSTVIAIHTGGLQGKLKPLHPSQ